MDKIAVCNKCGRQMEWNAARQAGWLISARKDAPDRLIVRCPEHVTGHALRTAGLPQQTGSAKVEQNLDRGLWATDGNGYLASASRIDGEYVLSSWDVEARWTGHENYPTVEALIAAMRRVEPDLRKWRRGRDNLYVR